MIWTADKLQAVMPFATGRIPTFVDPINKAMAEFMINTNLRQSAFIAQIAEESGELRYLLELASGSAYEGRADLGNTFPGDGPRFKGRGLIQITGRANYMACGAALSMDLVNSPSLLETPEPAARSAAWWWQKHGCNTLADLDHFGAITATINGSLKTIDQRIPYWLKARRVVGL